MKHWSLLLFSIATLTTGSAWSMRRTEDVTPAVQYISGGADERDAEASSRGVRAIRRALLDAGEAKRSIALSLSGVFILDAPITLDRTHAGSTISSSVKRRALLVSSGETRSAVVIDGADRVTIRGLAVRGFARDGIYARNARALTVAKNLVSDIRSTGWSQGGIHLTGSVVGALIQDNVVMNMDYAGIIVDTTRSSDVSRVRIIENSVERTCRKVSDCGAIYINDRGKGSTDIAILRNRVTDFGPRSARTRAIYLDDWASHVVVAENRIAGPGEYAFQIHGGRRNSIKNNYVDLRRIDYVLHYSRATDGSRADMTDNRMMANAFTVRTYRQLFPADQRQGEGAMTISGNRICHAGACNMIE